MYTLSSKVTALGARMQPQASTKPSFNQCNARRPHWARGVSRDVQECPDPQGDSYSPRWRHNSTVFVKSRPCKVFRGGRTLHIMQSGILLMSETLKCRCSQWDLGSTNFSCIRMRGTRGAWPSPMTKFPTSQHGCGQSGPWSLRGMKPTLPGKPNLWQPQPNPTVHQHYPFLLL